MYSIVECKPEFPGLQWTASIVDDAGKVVRAGMTAYYAEIECALLNAFHAFPSTYLLAKELTKRTCPEHRELWLNNPEKALDFFMRMDYDSSTVQEGYEHESENDCC